MKSNMSMEGKDTRQSRTIMSEIVMPNDTNPLGNLMGGNLMRWMDICAGICASRHSGHNVVTASVDNVSFEKPVFKGDVITLEANVTKAFRTSLEVFVTVHAADMCGANSRKSNHAYLTFVALDNETKRPVLVPPLKPITDEEIKLYEGANRRRELRLILAGRMKVSEATEIKDLFTNS